MDISCGVSACNVYENEFVVFYFNSEGYMRIYMYTFSTYIDDDIRNQGLKQ